MEGIARQGDSRYLVVVGDGRGRVVDLDARKVYPSWNLESLLARGYWEEVAFALDTLPEWALSELRRE